MLQGRVRKVLVRLKLMRVISHRALLREELYKRRPWRRRLGVRVKCTDIAADRRHYPKPKA